MSYTIVRTVQTGNLWTAADHNTYIRDNFAAGIPDIFTAKGQIVVAGGADAAGSFTVGSNEQILSSLASESFGLKYISAGIPIGGIILWYGDTNTIPSGFALCDGTNGTPDLRDKFIVGAGGIYAVGATGGASTHTHTQGSTGSEASHTHTQGNTGSESSHTHSISGTTSATSYNREMVMGSWKDYPDSYHTHNYNITSGAGSAHSHTNPTTNAGSAHSHTNPTTDASSNLPPYKAVMYIMRIS